MCCRDQLLHSSGQGEGDAELHHLLDRGPFFGSLSLGEYGPYAPGGHLGSNFSSIHAPVWNQDGSFVNKAQALEPGQFTSQPGLACLFHNNFLD